MTSVTSEATIGFDPYRIEAIGKFLVLEVTVTNNSNEQILFDPIFFLVLNYGSEYGVSGEALGSLMRQGDNPSMEYINPEMSRTGSVPFDVPLELADSHDGAQLQVQNGLDVQFKNGAFGIEKGLINLK